MEVYKRGNEFLTYNTLNNQVNEVLIGKGVECKKTNKQKQKQAKTVRKNTKEVINFWCILEI